MKITLKVTSNKVAQEIYLSQDQTLIFGRSSSADVKLEDGKVSGKHCQLILQKDRLEVLDLESKNGLFLNGIPIEQAEVFLGDEIRVGDSYIIVEEKSADKEASAILTFAGEENNKEKNDLRLDFTGARIANQAASRTENGRVKVANSFVREVELRKKLKSKIKLSKQEIRNRHKGVALFATLIDGFLLFLIVAIPFFLSRYTGPAELKKSKRILVFFIIEAFAIPTFILKNFKSAKFTFGEKVAGIKELYEQQ